MADMTKRIFPMSYAELIGLCNKIHDFQVRDSVQFESFGILPAAASEFQTKISEFANLPQDLEFEADLVNATMAKSSIANDIRVLLRALYTRAKLALGRHHGDIRRFHSKDLSLMNDNDLSMFAGVAVKAAEEFFDILSPFGLTQEMIDDLSAKNTAFATTVSDQIKAIADRDNATNVRVKKGNELYRLLIKYSQVGKNMWYEVNEAYYNDYVVSDYTGGGSSGGSSSVPAAPENLSVDVNTMIFSWSSVPNTQNYTLEKSAVGIEWEIIYTGPDNFFMYVPETEGINLYRVKGSNSIGSGLYSSMMSYNYVVPIPAPGYLSLTVVNAVTGEVALNWEEIAEADFFRVYVCSVATGAPAVPADYSLAGEFTVATFTATFGTGMRKYFYVKSGTSGGLLSSPSDSVYADL